jgi:NAD(P)-dependent dehydrogenase (short-subunit alcohol dehydrogenase family)
MMVLITGASSGIGAATARLLAAQGHTVGIVGGRADRLGAVLAACRAHTPDSRMWVADLGDLAVAEGIADEAWDQFEGLDVLINNAADIWGRPGEDPALFDIPKEPPETVAKGIVAALKSDRFEHYLPDLNESVVRKDADLDRYVAGLASMMEGRAP